MLLVIHEIINFPQRDLKWENLGILNLLFRYMSAAKEGDNIEVEAVTKKTGKKIAFLEVEVRNKDKNLILATGRHTKYIGV